jgi:Leucine-rich repeat (LRR) protein
MDIAIQRINQWVSNNNANEDLFLNNLNLRELPELPNNLQELDCSNNQLTSLPVLPNTLKYLNCSDNSLTILPILPDTLEDLVCRNNNLTNFPNLPNLYILYIDDIIIFTRAQIQQLYENEVEVIVRDRQIDLYNILTNNPQQQNNNIQEDFNKLIILFFILSTDIDVDFKVTLSPLFFEACSCIDFSFTFFNLFGIVVFA